MQNMNIPIFICRICNTICRTCDTVCRICNKMCKTICRICKKICKAFAIRRIVTSPDFAYLSYVCTPHFADDRVSESELNLNCSVFLFVPVTFESSITCSSHVLCMLAAADCISKHRKNIPKYEELMVEFKLCVCTRLPVSHHIYFHIRVPTYIPSYDVTVI